MSNAVFTRVRYAWGAMAALMALTPAIPARAEPAETVTYLLPAPETSIVFAPFILAQASGRYARAGLNVRFVVVQGGMNVGAALARGEGDLGGAMGDTPILLRAQGMAVKGVALLGRHSFLTLITQQGTPAIGPALKGKEIDVPSLQDTSFYALNAALRASSVKPGDVVVKAAPPPALIEALSRRQIAGLVGTVDWGVKAERSGVALDYRPMEGFFPAMAQAIMATDDTITRRPAVVRAFVRATLGAMRAIDADPAASATAYEAAMPTSGFSHAEIERVFSLLARHVYGAGGQAGHFTPGIMRAAVRADVALGLIPRPMRADHAYTNRFVLPNR